MVGDAGLHMCHVTPARFRSTGCRAYIAVGPTLCDGVGLTGRGVVSGACTIYRSHSQRGPTSEPTRFIITAWASASKPGDAGKCIRGVTTCTTLSGGSVLTKDLVAKGMSSDMRLLHSQTAAESAIYYTLSLAGMCPPAPAAWRCWRRCAGPHHG
jgi:hypothetical protein